MKRTRRFLHSPRAPLALLAVVCAAGVGLRAYRLSTPAVRPPNQGYIFDERYYVSAARVITGRSVLPGDTYFHAAPEGADPNGEHPQLGKLVIAAGIDVFGDNAIGWRITAVLFGAAAIALMYWLARGAGASAWLALGAASLGAFENLWLVHSRIAVLDIFAVPFMLAGAGFYLRRRPVLAGVLIGIGCCVKEFAVYTVLVLALYELLQLVSGRLAGRAETPPTPPLTPEPGTRRFQHPALRLPVAVLVTGLTFFSALSFLDALVTPYSGNRPVDRGEAGICQYALLWENGCNHFAFMNRYGAGLRDHGAPKGIATTPLQFWLDRKTIDYFTVTTSVTVGKTQKSTATLISFKGEMGRVILFTSWVALITCLWWGIRRRDGPALVAVAWAAGAWLPPALLHALDGRTTYIYYMVVAMPGLYLACARLFAARRIPRAVVFIWGAAVLWDVLSLYPMRGFPAI